MEVQKLKRTGKEVRARGWSKERIGQKDEKMRSMVEAARAVRM